MTALARAIVTCPAPGCGRADPLLVGFRMPLRPDGEEYSRYECVCGHEWTEKDTPRTERRRP